MTITTMYEVVRTAPGDALVVHTGSRHSCRNERNRLERRSTATYTVRRLADCPVCGDQLPEAFRDRRIAHNGVVCGKASCEARAGE